MSQCTPMLSMSGTFLSNQILPIKGKWEALKQRKLNISDLRENDPNEGAPKAMEPELDVGAMQDKASTSLRELELHHQQQQQQVEDLANKVDIICSRTMGGGGYVVEPSSTSAPSSIISAQDDEMLSWLHYPVDENFERSYCSEMFGDVSNPGMQQQVLTGGGRRCQPMVTNSTSVVSLVPKPPNAEAAMALGAERAAGLCSQVGLEAFCRVRTSSQPPVPKWLPPATTEPVVAGQPPVKTAAPFPLYSPPASTSLLGLKGPLENRAEMNSSSLIAESVSPRQRQENLEAVTRKIPVKKEQPASLTSAGGSSSCRTKSFENEDFLTVQRKYEPEPTITSSSGGSENTTEKSEKNKRKAKQLDSAECCQSEDVEAESVDTKKKTGTTRPKRTRAAEVHNLSERRRRDRINEKMRALQELIPNSNKTDKASMLDEAIEYLKMLQLQLQMMSMRSGMSVPPMVMPNGVQQHLQMQQMPSLAPYGMGMGMVGVNMGMGMGMGMNMVDLAGSSSIRPIVSDSPQHHQQQQQQQMLSDSYNVFVSQQQMQLPVQMMSREMYNSYMLPQVNQPNHHQDNQQQQQQQLHQIHHHSIGFNQ